MHILDIPTEILGEIFYHSKNLLQCALVCKSWNVPALQFLYTELYFFEAYRIYHIKQQLKMKANERDSYFKYGPFVKNIMINRDGGYTRRVYPTNDFEVDFLSDTYFEFDEEEFILLLEYFPNIQGLYLGSSNYASKYCQYILDTDSKRCLNQIQVISDDSTNTHMSICYKYRATVTSLVVNYNHIMMDLGSQHDKTLTFLSHFTRLTHLTVENTCDNYLTTLDIQNVCPHLTTLTYKSKNSIPDETVKSILNDPANRNLNNNLKSLTLYVPTVPVNYARYVTDYLSPQVDTLQLHISDVDLYDWIYDIGIDNALRLANQSSTVKDFSLTFTYDKIYKRNATSYKSKMTIFFELLNAMKGDKNTFCRIKYSDSGSFLRNSMVYSLEDGLCVDYVLEYVDYYRPNEVNVEQDDYMDQEQQSPRVVEIVLPDIASSMIGPEVINYIDITMRDSNPELLLKFLEYALINSPNLQFFDFKFTEEHMRSICIDIDTDKYKKRKNCHILSKRPQENLKVIETTNFIPSKELLNLISTYLPNIEFFACTDSGFCVTFSRASKITEIDFTAFKNLKTVYFDIQLVHGADYVFIHLKYSDGDEAYYCQKRNDELTFNPATLEFLQECNNNEKITTHSITIKYNKNIKFVVCFDSYETIAEIENGNLLDYISINSKCY